MCYLGIQDSTKQFQTARRLKMEKTDHAAEAERLINAAAEPPRMLAGDRANVLAVAQIHATLAVADALHAIRSRL